MTSEELIVHLGLERHPEGGWYRQTYLAAKKVHTARGERAASTAIYFLLSGNEFSALHRIQSDEVWHFYAGDTLIVSVIHPDGRHEDLLLGQSLPAGETLQGWVAAGAWFGARLKWPGTYALVGCTVAPGFDFADFEMGNREVLLRQFPQHAELVAKLTR
ncbi:cupin domain-containing protein [Terriglobus albidus]|uniref:cupin domain-containing protein n=1 Tax=Terriglobus albidus TaxID=1592106 RepID=UPI00164D81D6|nr:cupin domain-containing protein [Terriglobus albidus]